MKKLLLASAVASVFATPATVLAQAAPAPAVPTLGQVLDASGLVVSGYLDAAYSHADRNVEAGLPRVFDNQNNSFSLHQAGITVAKQPKEGFGGLINLTAGKDAAVIHSFDTTTESQFDVTQGFIQYSAGALTIIGGKFTTLAGTEVIASPGNTTFSRSILFGSVPFTHTGLRATYAVSDTVSLTAGLNNGWDQVRDTNKGKTLELGATFTPIKPLTIVVSSYSGKEETPLFTPAAPGVPEGQRNATNLVVTWSVSDPLTLGAEYLRVTQKNFFNLAPGAAPGSLRDATYSGMAGYVTYMFTPKWRGVVRLETFNDKEGLRFGAFNTKYKEYTLDLGYLATDNFEIRGELRRDTANNAVGGFPDFAGLATKNLTTYALQGIYKF
jgi:hypothetical protein